MNPRILHLDWRAGPDLSKLADYYSVCPYFGARPASGMAAGRVLVAISTTILMQPDGTPSTVPYYTELYAAAKRRGALTGRKVWTGASGYYSELFDVTRR